MMVLRVLLVDDGQLDPAALSRALAPAYSPVFQAVPTPETLALALEAGTWDLILAPAVPASPARAYDGLVARAQAEQAGQPLPLVVIASRDRVGLALDIVRQGADRYVLATQLDTLRGAVERALLRRAHREHATRLEVLPGLREAERLGRLQTLAAALVPGLSPDEAVAIIVRQGASALNATAGAIGLVDGDQLVLAGETGFAISLRQTMGVYPLSANRPSAEVARTSRPVFLQSQAEFARRYPELAALRQRLGLEALAALPLIVEERCLGVLTLAWQTVRDFGPADRAFLLALAQVSALALEWSRLHATLETRIQERTADLEQAREETRRTSAYLQQGLERERARISREVHDELGQLLTGLKIALSSLAERPPPPEALRERLQQLMAEIDLGVEVARRISADLRPSVLDDLGFVSAVEWLCQQFEERTGVLCLCEVLADDLQPSPEAASAAFRVLQEALTNVARHAEASQVTVELQVQDGHAVVSVADNGRGISPEQLADPLRLGLRGMRERLQLVGGRLEIESAPGQGTTVRMRLPL